MNDDPEPDWKLKLRYGRLTTPFQHYFVLAEGVAGALRAGFDCPAGPAFMGMKAWAASPEEARHMAAVIGRDIGFDANGRIDIYEAEASQPPRENPFGYDIRFTPFNEDGRQ